MLYSATSGCAVAATAVSGGVKLPEPQPIDVRANRMLADKHIPVREFFKFCVPPFQKIKQVGRLFSVFLHLEQGLFLRSDQFDGIGGRRIPTRRRI